MKNLTTEVAEVRMAKGSGCKGKSSPFSDASLKDKNAKGLSENDLCALCVLSG
jgi:hypothetical protein